MSDFYEFNSVTTEKELLLVLDKLISNWEYEVVEFKEAVVSNGDYTI